MNRKLLMTVSHDIEAKMFQEILRDAEITAYISEKNGPHVMGLYLGQKNEGVELYVDPEDYVHAKAIIEEAEIQD